MRTRREFLKHSAAAGVVVAASGQCARASNAISGATRIKSAIRREDTLLRLGGDGDCFHMSWAADDRQLVACCDGLGWSENPDALYNSCLFSVSGEPRGAVFQDLPSYPIKPVWDVIKRLTPAYYGFGTLALDKCIYQFLSAPNSHGTFVGAKLVYSPDRGTTWCNQDGSTPVVWEPLQRQSRKTMVFFEEPQTAFSQMTILQMGRNYESNADGFVYVYAPNGITDGTMNELVMFRVPKIYVLNRNAYEYFAGMRADGTAAWIKDIHARAVVHTFPRGWVNRDAQPFAWQPSVVYNAPLGVYMMANWGNGCGPDGSWFGQPSYFGLWIALNPWGPWTQIHEETAWRPGNDPKARAYQPKIAPKWIAKDGKSFWLVWSDFQHTSEFWPKLKEAASADSPGDFIRLMRESRQYRPYYSFNTQRVDLIAE